MAHNLNYNEQTEKHSFFSVKEKAWHGLGQMYRIIQPVQKQLNMQGWITQ